MFSLPGPHQEQEPSCRTGMCFALFADGKTARLMVLSLAGSPNRKGKRSDAFLLSRALQIQEGAQWGPFCQERGKHHLSLVI